MTRVERSISDYDALMNPIREARQAYSGHQRGDPARAGAAILTLIASDNPPAHLLLGSDALRLVSHKLTALQADIETWKPVTLSTDFPDQD